MKTLTITLIVGIVLVQSVISPAATSENSPARDLAAAKSFAFGGVGVAGIMSQGERNLRAVLQQSDASQELQAAFGHATPAGKLYILVGLRRCDRAEYQKVFDSLTPLNEDVEVARGCMITREPFGRLLSEFKTVDSMIICRVRHGNCSRCTPRPAGRLFGCVKSSLEADRPQARGYSESRK